MSKIEQDSQQIGKETPPAIEAQGLVWLGGISRIYK